MTDCSRSEYGDTIFDILCYGEDKCVYSYVLEGYTIPMIAARELSYLADLDDAHLTRIIRKHNIKEDDRIDLQVRHSCF
jgi:hypothetical protein